MSVKFGNHWTLRTACIIVWIQYYGTMKYKFLLAGKLEHSELPVISFEISICWPKLHICSEVVTTIYQLLNIG